MRKSGKRKAEVWQDRKELPTDARALAPVLPVYRVRSEELGRNNDADDADDELVADSIQAIGYIARVVPESTQQCLTALMSFIQSKHGSSWYIKLLSHHPHLL